MSISNIPKPALAAIEEYHMLPQGCKVVVGLSGGADSVCLLYILLSLREEYSLEISAAHINHGIRGSEADADAAFVSELCARLGIELDLYEYNVPKEAARMRLTVEEAGRVLRYRSFEASLKKRAEKLIGKIAVAHNKNDNAETVLMRIFRGTGMKGLAGISPIREDIIRPLIMTSRAEIENFCHENNIAYQTDSTNLKSVYTRNFIRLELFPLVEKLAPAALSNISRMTQIISEEEEYLDSLAADSLKRCSRSAESNLSITALLIFPVALRRRIIRLFLLRYTSDNRDVSYKHIEMALDLTHKKTGSMINLPSGLCLARDYDKIVVPDTTQAASEFCYELPFDTEIFVPEANILVNMSMKKPDNIFDNGCTKVFSYDKMMGRVQIRSRKPGDRIYVRGMGGNKKIKDYFIDAKIPRAERDKIPLLVCGDGVVWIMDDTDIISDSYKADESTQKKIYISKTRRTK